MLPPAHRGASSLRAGVCLVAAVAGCGLGVPSLAPSNVTPARDAGSIDRPSVTVDAGVDVPRVPPRDVGADTVVVPPLDAAPDGGSVSTLPGNERCSLGTARIDPSLGSRAYLGTTVGARADHLGSCVTADETANFADVVYTLGLDAPRRVGLSVRSTGAPWDPALVIAQRCDPLRAGSTRLQFEVGCRNDTSQGNNPAIYTVLPAGVWNVVVDGAPDTSLAGAGSYELSVDITPAPQSPYNLTRVANAPCPSLPSGLSPMGFNAVDDGIGQALFIGFDFRYFGRAVDRFVVYTNGMMLPLSASDPVYSTASTWQNAVIPLDANPNAVVAPLWDDLVIGIDSAVYTWIERPASGLVLHVRWSGMYFLGDDTSRVSFEARLFQGSNAIEFNYCQESGTNTRLRGSSATVGIEDTAGREGLLVSLNQPEAVSPNTLLRFVPR